jgi:hypothetical protein
MEDARAGQHRVGRAAVRQGSDAWDRRKKEVVLELLQWRAAVQRGSGRRRTTWRGQGVASAGSGSGGAEAGATRGRAQSGAGAARAAHMARAAAAARGRGKQRRGGER